MKKIRITKIFNIEMSHALPGHDGPCRNIHGHSYILHVTVVGDPVNDKNHPKQGMVMDFKDLKDMVYKTIIKYFDHAIVLNHNLPDDLKLSIKKYNDKIVDVIYQPTCENLILDFAERIKQNLPPKIKLCKLKLIETPSSYAEWFQHENY